MDYEAFYLDSLKKIMNLRRQLRAEQVKNTLARLATLEEKPKHLQDLPPWRKSLSIFRTWRTHLAVNFTDTTVENASTFS